MSSRNGAINPKTLGSRSREKREEGRKRRRRNQSCCLPSLPNLLSVALLFFCLILWPSSRFRTCCCDVRNRPSFGLVVFLFNHHLPSLFCLFCSFTHIPPSISHSALICSSGSALFFYLYSKFTHFS